MKRAPRVGDRLRQMLDAVAAIQRLTTGKTLAEFDADPDLAAAVERYLERLSEASRHVPQALKDRQGKVDWWGVANVGNVLRHAYHRIANPLIWRIVSEDLPPLKEAIEAIIKEVGKDD